MTFRYAIEPARQFCYIQIGGTVHGTALSAVAEQVYADPEMQPHFDVLWDASDIAEIVMNLDDFRSFRARVIALRGASAPGRGAIVAARDAVRSTAEYMKMTLRTDVRGVEVFYTLPSAMAWLGISQLPNLGAGAPRTGT